MQNLERTLRAYEPIMLGVIADRWDVDLESHSVTDIVALLMSVMLNPEAAADTWDRLDDAQRGAMQILLGSGGVMNAGKFFRLYGEIREMGPGRLEREKPYLNPGSVAEVLYYRGLIGRGFEEASAGPQAVIFVPTDLARVLPSHQTGFDLSEEEDDLPYEDEEDEEEISLAADQPDEILQADTSIVDDLTTLLAYLQVAAVPVRNGENSLPQAHLDTLDHFLLNRDLDRLAFIIGMARALDLIAARDGMLKPVSQPARRWLEASRGDQVRALAEGWRDTVDYNDLFNIPGLSVETASNDPRLARQIIIDLLQDLPPDSWWLADAIIEEVKNTDPDFQRPGGDYDSWYIRDEQSDGYLTGFGNWDLIEGRMLRYILKGPLHWLGLSDLGLYGGRTLGRLNAYGRTFVANKGWPAHPDSEDLMVLHENGTVEVSRKISRVDRFQISRFTEWLSAGPSYRYRFSPRGLRRASNQGIKPEHVRAFMARVTRNEYLPEGVEAMLTRWAQAADADATIERLTVLRMASQTALDAALEEPAVRRYVGARLGPEAVIVRPGQAEALQDALADFGLLADIISQAGDQLDGT